MEVTLYNFKKRVNSTKNVNVGGEDREVLLKGATSTFSPIFILSGEIDFNVNYLKFNDKYYYINDIVLVRKGTYELVCSLDYLASFKNDILKTSAYVSYATEGYDTYLRDNRLSTNETADYKINEKLLFSDVIDFDTDFSTCVINYVSAKGGSTKWISEGQLVLLMEKINEGSYVDTSGEPTIENNSFLRYVIALQKEFNNVYDCILSCTKLPFKYYDIGATGSITLSGWETGMTGKSMLDPSANYECDIAIPTGYGDFRDLAPYTSLALFLPGYGYLELNPDDHINRGSINVKAYVDFNTGECTYLVGNTSRCTANFGTSIPIGTIQGNATSLVSGALAIGAGVASGGVGLAVMGVQGIDSIIASQQRSLGSTGGQPSQSSMFATAYGIGNVALVKITHDTNQSPDSYTTTLGRPCNKVMDLDSLSGYVQTVNASVHSINEPISNLLNNYMNGGIYIE